MGVRRAGHVRAAGRSRGTALPPVGGSSRGPRPGARCGPQKRNCSATRRSGCRGRPLLEPTSKTVDSIGGPDRWLVLHGPAPPRRLSIVRSPTAVAVAKASGAGACSVPRLFPEVSCAVRVCVVPSLHPAVPGQQGRTDLRLEGSSVRDSIGQGKRSHGRRLVALAGYCAVTADVIRASLRSQPPMRIGEAALSRLEYSIVRPTARAAPRPQRAQLLWLQVRRR